MSFVKEEKFFASARGSYLRQLRVRCLPYFNVTVVDKKSGRFETRQSLAAGRGTGYEYLEEYDFIGEAAKATEEAKQKHSAKSVEPGRKDLVIHPTNLWLTIHESIGHPTELDRALGYEANFAGTSFVTPEKLGKLKYGSDFLFQWPECSEPKGEIVMSRLQLAIAQIVTGIGFLGAGLIFREGYSVKGVTTAATIWPL